MTNDTRYGPRILALVTFAAGADAFLVAGVLPALARSFDVSVPTAGQAVTVFALTYAIGSPVLAVVTGEIDRRRVLLAALAAFGLANAVSALAPTFGVFLAARLLAGVAAAMLTPNAVVSAVVLSTPERRGRALGAVMGGMSAGTVLGLPAGTALGGVFGWRAAFWLIVGVTLVSLLATARWLPSVRVPSVNLATRLAPLRQLAVAHILAVTVILMTGAFAVTTYLAVVIAPATGGSSTVLAVLLAVNGVAGVIGTSAAGRLVDRWGGRPVLLGLLIVLTAVFGLLDLVRGSLALTTVVLLGSGLAGMGTVVAQQHRLAALGGPTATLVIGLNGAAIYLGSALAGSLGGAVISGWGVSGTAPVAALLVLTALVLAVLPLRRDRAAVPVGAEREQVPAN